MSVPNLAKQIIVIATAIICVFICVPFIAYHFSAFYKYDSIMIRKRHPNILKLQGIGIMLWFIIGIPFMTTDWILLDDFKGYKQEVVSRINSAIYPFLSHCIFIATAWRFWHIYFDLKYSSSQKNSEWKYHLDPSLVQHNFWLTHKKDFGSSKWTQKLIIIYYFISAFLVIGIYQCVVDKRDPDYYFYFGLGSSAIFHGIPCVIALILWCKVPDYSDHFFIKYEMKTISILFTSTCAGALIAVGAGFFMDSSLAVVWAGLLGSSLFFVNGLLSFWWIPRKIRWEQLQHNLANLNYCSNSNESSARTQEGNTKKDPNTLQLGHIVRRLSTNAMPPKLSGKKQCYKLHAILSNERGLKIFMQHLAKEFSTECLLCFLETIQYKFAFKKRCDLVNSELIDDDMNVSQPPMAEAAPMSFIIKHGFVNISKYKRNDDPATLVTEAKNVCVELFQKYIETGSELEVNISYESRSRLKNLMTDVSFFMESKRTANFLFKIFDDVSTEMFRLMHGAYTRFKNKPSFDAVVKALHNAM